MYWVKSTLLYELLLEFIYVLHTDFRFVVEKLLCKFMGNSFKLNTLLEPHNEKTVICTGWFYFVVSAISPIKYVRIKKMAIYYLLTNLFNTRKWLIMEWLIMAYIFSHYPKQPLRQQSCKEQNLFHNTSDVFNNKLLF